MEFTDNGVLKFMKQYFRDYSDYAQNPGTVQRMYDYFTPDFEFTPFIAGNATISGRENFLRLMSSHPSSYETITPEDIFIDVKRKVVVVLARTEVVDRKNGEVVVRKRYLPRYHLALDDNGNIKIKKLIFFWEVLPRGAPEVHEVFRRDLK